MAHRYRLYPEPDQTAILRRHCGDARFVWSLALEQLSLRLPGRRPGSAERFRQLAAARNGTWLREGSRLGAAAGAPGFRQGREANWRAGEATAVRRWRQARGLDEGFCVRDVHVHVHVVNRRWAEITVPKCGAGAVRATPAPARRIARDGADHPRPGGALAREPHRPRSPSWSASELDGRSVSTSASPATDGADSDGRAAPHCPWLRNRGNAAALRRLAAPVERGSGRAPDRRERTKAADRGVARTTVADRRQELRPRCRPAPVSSASTT